MEQTLLKTAFKALPREAQHAAIGMHIWWLVTESFVSTNGDYVKLILNDGRVYEFDQVKFRDWRLRLRNYTVRRVSQSHDIASKGK